MIHEQSGFFLIFIIFIIYYLFYFKKLMSQIWLIFPKPLNFFVKKTHLTTIFPIFCQKFVQEK